MDAGDAVMSRIEFLEVVIRHDPDDVGALVELGWRYYNDAGDWERAKATLKDAITRGPRCAEAYFWLAKVYYHGGVMYEEAVPALEQALRCDPEHAPSLSLLASICKELGDLHRAEELVLKAIDLEPTWIMLHRTADSIRSAQGNLCEAITHARTALRLAREFHPVSTKKSYSYYEAAVTSRWIDSCLLRMLEQRAARREAPKPEDKGKQGQDEFHDQEPAS
jgi:tetratricopeptide (TPR) repeat protein